MDNGDLIELLERLNTCDFKSFDLRYFKVYDILMNYCSSGVLMFDFKN